MNLEITKFHHEVTKIPILNKSDLLMICQLHPSFIISFLCKHDLPHFAKSNQENNAQSLKFTTS